MKWFTDYKRARIERKLAGLRAKREMLVQIMNGPHLSYQEDRLIDTINLIAELEHDLNCRKVRET